MKKLLLLSNSKVEGFDYLGFAEEEIKSFLGKEIQDLLFIPYAAVSFSYDKYEEIVKGRFERFGYRINSIHKTLNPQNAVKHADAIIVGGGNTFHLLDELYRNDLINILKAKLENGTPYIGWSAGANLACPTIKTTNDMPVVYPPSFDSLNQIPFQINPHFTDAQPEGHKGETRSERINEFLVSNPDLKVVGLPEGCILKIYDEKIELIGERKIKLFAKDQTVEEFSKDDDLNFLLT